MNGEKRWAFIINPVAGNGFASTMEEKIREMASRNSVNPAVEHTGKRGDASELSKHFADNGYQYIIGVGGDGTFNEVAAPLAGREGIVTGLVPAGTGNDFIQILGFSDRFSDNEWMEFFRASTISMDAGICNGMLFFNGMGLGFDAAVAAENYTEPGQVKKGGKNKYLWHIIKTILFYREREMHSVTGNMVNTDTCFMNTVSNGRRFAGGFFLTPQALANDGLLDVCMVRKISVPRRLYILTKVPKGTHINESSVKYYRTERLLLEFDEKVPFHLDGELYFNQKFEITVRPSAVNVIFNPSGNHYFKLST